MGYVICSYALVQSLLCFYEDMYSFSYPINLRHLKMVSNKARFVLFMANTFSLETFVYSKLNTSACVKK